MYYEYIDAKKVDVSGGHSLIHFVTPSKRDFGTGLRPSQALF